MKELVNIAANFGCALTEGGTLSPQVEVTFILTEPSYRQDATGELERTPVLTEVRVSMTPAQLRRMARGMSKTAEEAEVMIVKALNDHAARWAAAQPAEDTEPPEGGTTNEKP